jgi:hypothetical protein
MNVGDLLIYSQNCVDVQIFGIVIEVLSACVVVATQDHGVRVYSMDVINSFAVVAK